ncbi:MAG: multicopper oxidase family protein [Candidatus Baltobacteraceae bacterium]
MRLRRASFLQIMGGGMAAFALPALHERALASDVVDYTLTATRYRFSPVPGVAFDALAYNGTVPGPVLRVALGQRFRAKYVNKTNVSTSIHWHGMILPNAMDGVVGVTQKGVAPGRSFQYDFTPGPAGTRWYHDHDFNKGTLRGLYGMIVVEDPHDDKADAEFALVFHDVPRIATVAQAMRGLSHAPMSDPMGSPELLEMAMDDKMGDEVAYSAHCINGASYPNTKPLKVAVGQKVRLRILNANATQTRYVRLAGHTLRVTHADGNPLTQPLAVDALRVGIAERYDAWFEVTKPGAWLLQGISADPLSYQQAVVVYTEGMEHATPMGNSQSLEGVDYFTYEKAAGLSSRPFSAKAAVAQAYTLGGGAFGSDRWTLSGKVYPNTEKIFVHRGDSVIVRFKNTTDMEHPMHLHGHTFNIVEIDGKALLRPMAKDVSLVRANNGTLAWQFDATSPAGRWLLHCHNDIHMMDGMMTEVVYR